MISRFLSFFHGSREHWLFTPMFILILLIGIYNFLFSKKGYIAYQNKLYEKQKIEKYIDELKKEKLALEKKLGILKNDKEAIEKFTKDYFLYDDSVTIIKFVDLRKEIQQKEDKKINLDLLQKLYIVIASLVIISITWFFGKRHNQNEIISE